MGQPLESAVVDIDVEPVPEPDTPEDGVIDPDDDYREDAGAGDDET